MHLLMLGINFGFLVVSGKNSIEWMSIQHLKALWDWLYETYFWSICFFRDVVLLINIALGFWKRLV